MKPYWRSSDGAITVYHARYEDVLAAGCVPVREVALVHDDPPYGIDFGKHAIRKRGRPSTSREDGTAIGRSWAGVVGDDAPFDPAPLLVLDRPTVMWGGNNFASRLPDSGGWIVWDKKRGGTASQGHKASDAELAWSNIGRMVDLFSFFWDGFRREGEVGSHLHPTQKPIELCSFVYRFAKLKPGDLVFVPHGGSGPDLPACRAASLKLIWCECERTYCDTAIARLGAVTPERAAHPVGPLFTLERAP